MKQHPLVHETLRRRFRIIAFDWDGTAVKNRAAPVDDILPGLEALMALDVKIVIITGTHLGNPGKQFCSKVRPELKRNLFACVNRGGEVYGFDDAGEPVRLRGRDGQVPVRWLPDLFGGRGLPHFLYYHPLVFFMVSLLHGRGDRIELE